MGNTTSAPELQGEREQRQQRPFDLSCESYTPEMFMDDFERFQTSDDADILREVGPLGLVASSGRTDIVEFMLARGHDKDVLNDEGCTPLLLAAILGHMGESQYFIVSFCCAHIIVSH